MSFDKIKCLKLLNSKKLVEEKFGITLREYNLEKYYELQDQLIYIKDFIIWENSFSQYFRLFTNFITGLISGESFMDEFIELFYADEKLLENFVFNSENLKNLNINPKSFGFFHFLQIISIKCEFFEDDASIRLDGEIDENQLRSYITKMFSRIEFFK
jgi:hypothetical protein